MTAAAREPEEAEVLQFGGADTSRDKTNDHVRFYLGDEGEDPTIYQARRPKMAVLLTMANALMDDGDPIKQAAAFDGLMAKILEPESEAALRARLEDPDDDLDLDSPNIETMFRTLVGLWYGRPTGKPAGSPRSPSRTGRRSTARRRSGG